MGLKAAGTVSNAPKGKGLLKQVTEVFPNIVTGVAKLAGHAAYTPIGIGRAIGDMSSGKLPSQQTGGSFLSRLKLNLHKYTPFAEDVIGIGESIPKTVGNVGQFTASLAPGGMKPSDTEYGIANREGRIVNTVVGDVANLSLLAGAGAKAAAKLGAPVAASRLASVARLGDQAGLAPAKIWTEPIRLAGKIPVRGGTLAEAAKAATEGVLGRTPGTALWGTEAGRALKTDIIEGRQQIAEMGSAPIADIAKPAIKAGVSVPESQAAGLVLQGEAPVLAKIAETGKLAEFVKSRYPELDPQAAELAVKYHAGLLDEAATGRIDVARETYQALSDRQTGLAREGVGSPVKLSEEQLGNAPLSSVVDDARFKLEKRRDSAQQIADLRSGQAARERARADARRGFEGDPFTAGKAEQRAASLETKARRAAKSRDYYNAKIAGLPAKMDSVIEAAPARFRPAMRTAGEGVKFLHDEAAVLDKASPGTGDVLRKLADDIPTSLSQLTAAGVDPTHIIGGLAPGSVGGGGSLAVKTRKLTQQFVRQGGESDLSLPGVVKKYEADSVRRYQNLVAENIAKTHAVSPSEVGVSSSLVGPELAAQMEAMGYKPFATNRLGASVPVEQVTQSTRFMAAPLHDAFANWFKTTPDNAFVQGSTWLNRKWKNTVLPLSPRWHIGNIVGNGFLGTLGAGVDPVSLLKAVREAKAGRSWREWMADDGSVAGTPSRLYNTGLQHGDYAALFKGEVKEPRTILGRTINKSYRFNEFVDNVGRSAVYLNKLEQATKMGPQLSKAGLTAEEFALRESLKAMGDFSRMTPFEQSYVKNVIPFYAWCVDDQTECLTKRGWVNGWDLRDNDTILSMDPETQGLKWSALKSIYRNPDYDGPMWKFKNTSIDALVTPGHSWVLTDGRLLKTEELRERHVLQLMGTAVEGAEVYSDSFVELVGWAVTEGHYRKNRATVEIAQKDGTPTCDRIRDVLKMCGARFHEYKGGVDHAIRYYGVSGHMAAAIRSVAPGRVMAPEFLSGLSQHQRELLIDTMVAADGWQAARGKGDPRMFVQKDKRAADTFAALCTMAGYPTYTRVRDGGCFVVTIKARRTTGVRRVARTQETYRGLVWCPETHYGTFVARRNGITYVTGNTRHMTQVSWRLPLEHPMRVAWTISLADRFGDQGDLPDYIRGNLKVGGTFLPTRALSPFSDIGAGALLNPASAARGVSPFIKLPVAAATGINLSRGFNQTSRPKGTGNLDSLGRETFTPLINRPGELANVALGQVPVARNLRDLIQGSAPRYDTGQRIKGLERQTGAGRVYKPLLDILSVPRPLDTSQDQIERTLAAAAKRRAANAKLKK